MEKRPFISVLGRPSAMDMPGSCREKIRKMGELSSPRRDSAVLYAARGRNRRSAMVSRRNTSSAFSSFDSPTRTTGEPLRWRRSISNGLPSMYSSSRRGQTYDLRQTAAVLPSCSAVASMARLILRLRCALLAPCPCMASAIEQSAGPGAEVLRGEVRADDRLDVVVDVAVLHAKELASAKLFQRGDDLRHVLIVDGALVFLPPLADVVEAQRGAVD